MNMQDEYAIVWETSEKLTTCIGNVDQGLLKRAVANLIQNSMGHNELWLHDLCIRVARRGRWKRNS